MIQDDWWPEPNKERMSKTHSGAEDDRIKRDNPDKKIPYFPGKKEPITRDRGDSL